MNGGEESREARTAPPAPASFWSKLWPGRRGVKLRDMARVRVHARVGQEGKVPMVGLLPRAALAEIRRRMGEARRKAGGQCHLEAVPQSAEKVRVIVPPATEAQEGWRVVLRLRVREGEEPAPQHLRSRVRVELEDLVREAELVAETSG